MKKALITGIAGFVGSHLAEFLLGQKFQVWGFYHPQHSITNIEHIKNKLNLIATNIQDMRQIAKSLKKINPDYVFHLAAFSSPSASFTSARQTLENNILGELNLLESLVSAKSAAKILIIGSCDEYGNIAKKYLPATEDTPIAPISPYAVSKVAQDFLGLQFFFHHRLAIVRVRPFNHIGPRQSADFVVPSFVSQIATLEKKGGGTILVGNLNNIRDFTDVRDMVKAYLLALDKGIPGEVYNIGTGIGVKIADILKILISLSTVKINVEVDKNRFRAFDISTIYCDYSKFKKQTGWYPKIPLEKTLSDTIEYERRKLSQSL